jgi:hypothetical protein
VGAAHQHTTTSWHAYNRNSNPQPLCSQELQTQWGLRTSIRPHPGTHTTAILTPSHCVAKSCRSSGGRAPAYDHILARIQYNTIHAYNRNSNPQPLCSQELQKQWGPRASIRPHPGTHTTAILTPSHCVAKSCRSSGGCAPAYDHILALGARGSAKSCLPSGACVQRP